MAGESKLKITIEALNLAKDQLKALEKDLLAVEKAGKESGKGPKSLSDSIKSLTENVKGAQTPVYDLFQAVAGQALAATGVLVGFGAALKGAFDIAKEGAAVRQTADSFTGLIERMGASSDLLERLREASRGTVDDLKLMSSTTTLLAGAQGQLGTSLADATPQLLEIAKAANKLNPALGDTTFQYESLALGIKRGSPMILDNLGLTIKIEEANKRYAESLGKTASELDANEQKIALLNEVLRAGNVLIDQAGGTTESAADEFARFEANTKNLTDSLKAGFMPVVNNVVVGLNAILFGTKGVNAALKEHEGTMRGGATSYAAYRAEMERSAKVAGLVIDAEGNLARVETAMGAARNVVVQQSFALTEEQFNLARAADMAAAAEAKLAREDGTLAASTADLAAALKPTKEELEANARAVSSLNGLMAGAVGNELQSYGDKQTELRDKSAELQAKAAELKAEIDKLNASQGQQFSVTKDAALSANELNLAQLKLADSQQKLNETTDPLKQAQLAVEIEKLQSKISGASVTTTGYVDNSKRLAEVTAEYEKVNSALADNNSALDENAAAHEEASRRIMFSILQQQAAVDGFTTAEVTALTTVAEKWGLIDPATAAATAAVSQALSEASATGKWDDFYVKIDTATAKLMGLPRKIDIDLNVRENISARAAQFGAEPGPATAVRPTPTTQAPIPVSGAYASGGSFTVPGSGTTDRPYTVNMTPGEHVAITPSGQNTSAGGTTWNGNIVIPGAGDPQATAQAVIRVLQDRGMISRAATR